ncbi:MAG: 23S rRNA (guanosine(2251)-2'-O)-methyltransferase RlmB [Clostridiales bacterium]|nr:23S rRNA (guanosine(2251)-2'-O)-methyltransferase RlmB [Clostridiales bacterium]
MKRFDDKKTYNKPKNTNFKKQGEKRFNKPQNEKPVKRFENREDAEKDENAENILEGRNPIREALKAGRHIEKLLVAQGEIQGSVKEIVYDAKANGAIIQEVERTRLDRISITGAHQGIIAYVAVKEYVTVEDILDYAKEKEEDPFIVILDGICDPQNLGAIIRTCECAGVHGVIIPQRRAVGLTPVVAKCSAGAIEYMRISRVTNISQVIEKLKKEGIWVYGASMEGKNYARVNMTGPCALVIGAEGEGLSQLVKRNCDCLISMQQLGKIDSLNASVAAGILIYDCLRQKGEKN